jgi:hypothetical protein
MKLCKQHGLIPKDINIKRFCDREEYVMRIDNIGINHAFFYMVNARYCDEQPYIPRMTMKIMDKTGCHFLIAYVLGHALATVYDEEHSALPDMTYYSCPPPRTTLLWAIRLHKFIRQEEKTLTGQSYWGLFDALRDCKDDIDLSLRVHNKHYNQALKCDLENTLYSKGG